MALHWTSSTTLLQDAVSTTPTALPLISYRISYHCQLVNIKHSPRIVSLSLLWLSDFQP